MQAQDKKQEWVDLQYEHIDWNDIIDAEMSGDVDALLLLRRQSEEKRKAKEFTELPNQRLQVGLPLSYAYAVSPSQHGIKRTISERVGLSPIECCPKRNARSRVEIYRVDVEHTPSSTMPCSSNEGETPDDEISYSKTNSGAVQRRLFASPKQLPSTKTSPNQEITLHRLDQRQKQIDFGKNTLGYQRYIQTVPRWERKPIDPVTPDKNKSSSTRGWQGQIRLWRRTLHAYDPPAEDAFTSVEASLCEM